MFRIAVSNNGVNLSYKRVQYFSFSCPPAQVLSLLMQLASINYRWQFWYFYDRDIFLINPNTYQTEQKPCCVDKAVVKCNG